jgi:hypothetical protein
VHVWYLLDPAKGFAVTREESFSFPLGIDLKTPEKSGDHYVRQFDDFQKSPTGFWYPAHMSSEWITNDRSPDRIGKTDDEAFFHFAFEPKLTDEMFSLEAIAEGLPKRK